MKRTTNRLKVASDHSSMSGLAGLIGLCCQLLEIWLKGKRIFQVYHRQSAKQAKIMIRSIRRAISQGSPVCANHAWHTKGGCGGISSIDHLFLASRKDLGEWWFARQFLVMWWDVWKKWILKLHAMGCVEKIKINLLLFYLGPIGTIWCGSIQCSKSQRFGYDFCVESVAASWMI